ncbi:MAG: NADH-quinone oxidoreductase subunit A [Bacteroidetes bacterium]|nr:MAG: NADH-quinone oxidoreductase subunit A [Bacteroidota bacterium]REK06669.1 MAG: NADH-quinone oxidoreductase subunit A [Bacteroidota bacterium]REK33435.1 MAG: NADH-quinone oxidoreductase subunit A [Bacteroidota bacterium]REK47117.1 MAG: NADH-quinone oxidoreductase subunit A [Bacteroidota bacterium]
MGAGSMILLILCGVAFSAGGIILSRILSRSSYNPQKGQTYECGVPTIGKSLVQLNVGYYLFALLFLIFDVELVFLYPWAVVVKQVGWPALIEVLVFLFILFLGFLYAHKKGALKWM